MSSGIIKQGQSMSKDHTFERFRFEVLSFGKKKRERFEKMLEKCFAK